VAQDQTDGLLTVESVETDESPFIPIYDQGDVLSSVLSAEATKTVENVEEYEDQSNPNQHSPDANGIPIEATSTIVTLSSQYASIVASEETGYIATPIFSSKRK
jgi:hypothetical protein